MKKKYWFYLSPSVFIWRKGNECYFYDSEKFKGLLFILNDTTLAKFIDSLLDIDNLYCLSIEYPVLISIELSDAIQKLIFSGMARLVECNHSCPPIQLPPILNLQSDVNRLGDTKITDLTIGEDILTNLHELQISFSNNFDIKYVKNLICWLDSLKYSSLSNVNIYSPVNQLNNYDEFWNTLNKLHASNTFFFYLTEIDKSIFEKIKTINIKNILNVKIIILPNFDDDKLMEIIECEFYLRDKYKLEFWVSSEGDYEKINYFIEKYNLHFFEIKPYWNETNISFFEKYVYTNESDILNFTLTKKNIFAHQVLNTYYFGRLFITSDSKIYADPNHKPIGTINDDIRLLISQELTNGVSWRRIRDLKPCSDCLYQWLCPSPSSYETEINKPNLCHIKS